MSMIMYESTEPRTASRDSLLLMAELRDVEGQVIVTVRVRNLSATGLMADLPEGPVLPDHLIVQLRGIGEVGAIVRWRRQGRIGMEFDQVIDPAATRRPVGTGTATTGSGSARSADHFRTSPRR